jgi:hypothetical protein
VKEPDGLFSFFIRPLSQVLASHSDKCGKNMVSCQAKMKRNQKQSATWAVLASDGTLLLFTPFFFLSSTSAITMRLLCLQCR